ncbi:MAG: caspase family protein, partial [Nitrospirae bacterium]|nr:caspase family protein [Nitrospirota bacterium]
KAVEDLAVNLSRNFENALRSSVKMAEFAKSRSLKPVVKETIAIDIHQIPDFKSTPQPNDLAVIIGIENYQSLPKSDYSKSDASIVKDYLKALGFAERNIEFITDERATKSSIEKSLEAWLPNRVKKDSRVFVYYSGHGAPEPKTGDAYIVPFDGDPNYLEVTGYPLKRLYDKLGKLQVAEVVVLLDSCFSGAGGRSVLAKGARPLVMMTEGIIMPQNMAVLSATQGTQISTSSPEKGHGIFTYYVLKAIKDGKKNIAEIYEYIKPLVEDEAKQLNVQQSPSISPDVEKLKGRFGLRK